MAKNFRFHEGSDVYGWDNSAPLNNKAIAAIKDPDGANADREITSIPSPFARINLIKTAFQEVSNSTNLSGNTIYHKMVSDALDIGEILFNYDKYQADIDIISWDPIIDLSNLINANNASHKLLGRTLELYLKQDAKSNNFDKMNKIYLLNYNKGVNTINIIGGTSPASLFFTSANKFELQGFQSGHDQFFDDEYCSLHKRDEEYIKYLFTLKSQIPNFNTDFKPVAEYFERVFKELPQDLKLEINQVNSSYYESLPPLNIKGGGEIVEVLGLSLKKSKGKMQEIANSDFLINAEKQTAKLPKVLVLPNDTISGNYKYVTHPWVTSNKAPHMVQAAIEDRILPFDGSKYPFLTVSDLLEPVIIRTSLPIDKYYFEKAGYEGDKSYLLPLKPLFFEYFSTDFLDKNINGEKTFEIKSLSNNNVEVFLRIPIKNDKHITYKRVYYNPVNQSSKPEYNEENNKGAIIENRINLGISPFYKFPEDNTAEYNIAFYDSEFIPLLKDVSFKLEYYTEDNKLIQNIQQKQRRYKNEENVNMYANIVNQNFDYIRLQHDFGAGLLIPKFKENIYGGSNQFSFAIDFGTTNTHIEYALNNGIPEAFELTEKELNHIGHLIDGNKHDEPVFNLIKDDLVPNKITKDGLFKFPQRTVSAFHNKINFSQPIFSMANITIPFKYEQSAFSLSTEIKTNLKWNIDPNSSAVMESFFEQLIKMIRNKVFLNNGDIHKTKIVWSYPASMLQFQLNRMESQLTKIINKYLGDEVVIDKVCESLTPFYYYTNVEGITALDKPIVSIDIGGGTSDVAVYKGDSPILFSSYRFAGDAIFGDNYNRNIKINGFVNKYHTKFLDLLKQNNASGLENVLGEIISRNNSNDAINALFSIEKNKQLRDKQVNISLLDQLRNDNELKIIFLLFYIAQIYHVAKILLKKEIDVPGAILFSGTASKLITILDDSKDKEIINQITQKIIKTILNKDEKVAINVVLANNPKELTSKGALYFEKAGAINLKEVKDVLVTDDTLLKAESDLTYDSISILEEKALNDYNEFLEFFKSLNMEFSFKDNFGIENYILKKTIKLLENKKVNALKMGIKNKLEEIENPKEEPISETLFFYPLVGSLGELAYNLSKNRK